MATPSESNDSLVTATLPWPNKKDDYELNDSIGVGATATVYKVELFDCNRVSAFIVSFRQCVYRVTNLSPSNVSI